jgi:Amt family ammonium transporter
MIDPQHAKQPHERILPATSPDRGWAGMPAEQLKLAARFGELQRALAASDAQPDDRMRAAAGGLREAAALLEMQRTAARLEVDLRAGLARGAFHYEFQPMFRALTGEVYGYEALLRWTHEGKVVLPGRFVPLVDDGGLLGEIQASLLGSVAALLALPDFTGVASLNWSPAQLARRSDVSAFAARVLALGLDPARIVIEISGSAALRDPQEARECLVFLKDLGFRVALDDFGRGHDGFSYLCNLPIDIVKVDGALVRGLSDSPRARMVLGAVVDVAHRLGHLVVAEGVETLDQLIGAARLGCGLVQGFLVGAPRRQPRQVQCGDPALFGIR